jgi:hypothetical protein
MASLHQKQKKVKELDLREDALDDAKGSYVKCYQTETLVTAIRKPSLDEIPMDFEPLLPK